MLDEENDSLRTEKYSLKTRLIFALLSIAIVLIFSTILFMVVYGIRAWTVYSYVKSNQRGWVGKMHQADPMLGLSLVPNSQGGEIYPIGPLLPEKVDEDGFRVPIDSQTVSTRPRPLVLALGCSFTYGSSVEARDAFPEIVARNLGGSAINGGVCSYGLAQMVLRARSLIPKYKPDYLLVQYSTWLADRAQEPYAASYFGKIPTPYFVTKNGVLEVEPPLFRGQWFGIDLDRFRDSEKGILDFADFFRLVGLPLVYDDLFAIFAKFKMEIGALPMPQVNDEEIVRSVYKEIGDLAEEYSVKPVLVLLGAGVSVLPNAIPESYIQVRAQDALQKELSRHQNVRYEQLFNHWRGDPPVLVDSHPNEKAHQIIADEIILRLKSQNIGGQ